MISARTMEGIVVLMYAAIWMVSYEKAQVGCAYKMKLTEEVLGQLQVKLTIREDDEFSSLAFSLVERFDTEPYSDFSAK